MHISAALLGGEERAAVIRVIEDMLSLAHAEHPSTWIDPATFAVGALERVATAAGADDDAKTGRSLTAQLRELRAADLYFALACARGNGDAVALFERVHMTQVADFIARIDSSSDFAAEVRQRLRARLLVGPAPRIATYSARGPLGGWLRICAVREARSEGNAIRKDGPGRDLDAIVGVVDPEVAFLKQEYGALVSDAFGRALGTLDASDRTLLRMHYVDGMTLEQMASVFRVSRATGARMLAKTRGRVVDLVRQELRDAISAGTSSANSVMSFVRSRIELDLEKHLASEKR